jgi:single-stranded DNA-specific DHH superfamily exonuclease
MLTEKQIKEIREHLDRAQNPVFYYDNDADGLCSFLLLRRYLDRGKGVAVRSYPDLDKGYAQKASELGADYVFILDKPVVSKEFVDAVVELGLPIVWIDHHAVEGQNEDFSKVENFWVYNSATSGEKKGEPVTYLSYRIAGERKEDMWIAMMGCIADHYLPDFSEEFGRDNGELWKKGVKEPFDAYYGTGIGKIARAVGYGLKDSISNVVRMQNFLINVKGPDEVLAEGKENYAFRKKYKEIGEKYSLLLSRAREQVRGRVIFFSYSGELSISADIANELSYLYKGKYICIGFKKGAITNLSMRGRDVRAVLERILGRFEGATGGGHEDAVGARIRTEDLDRFKDLLEKEVNP